jgi:hypothetical protein
LKQYVICGEKTIIQNSTDQKKDHEKNEFQAHEVYAVDGCSGEVKPRIQNREPPSTDETPLNNMARK